ncbi:MAG: hypothetical protein HY360_10170 [Verrucomicrobia bacterium]|nr:hypothetical protein [Verrucomicrobiota bacterium]
MKTTKTLVFTKEKETKNTIRFTEQIEQGSPPVIGTLYLQKWFVGTAGKVSVTISVEDADPAKG